MFDLPGSVGETMAAPTAIADLLTDTASAQRKLLLEDQTTRSGRWFDKEIDKLENWAEDRRASLRADLDSLDLGLKEGRKQARLAGTLPEKLELQKAVRTIEAKRDEAWRAFDAASRDIDRRKDALLDEIAHRLEQKAEHTQLFNIRWRLT